VGGETVFMHSVKRRSLQISNGEEKIKKVVIVRGFWGGGGGDYWGRRIRRSLGEWHEGKGDWSLGYRNKN